MAKQKILIADDKPTNIKTLLEILKYEGDYEFFIATDGQKAVEIACYELPDLVLLDIIMPKLDGYKVCEKLQQNPNTQEIPIIFITALESDIDESRGFEVGAVDYIHKPVNPLTARARVKTHLELKKQRDILKQLSSLDGLTTLYNKTYFNDMLMQEWNRAKRDNTSLSLIMIDIDYFKQFNDNYGHLAGDKCLQQVSLGLKNSLERKTDICCRYGGEEFVTLLPTTDLHGAVSVAKRQQQNIDELKLKHQHSKISAYLTISLGVGCLIPKRYDNNPEVLISLADSALYMAKDSGRNSIRFLTNPHESLIK